MSFGWSVGDVVAGLKVVWDIYEAVSDGPLNAHYEAAQFFDEFVLVVSRLDDLERRRTSSASDKRLATSNQQLREQCTLFIKRHMSLVQVANPRTKAIRQGRSTWLQKASFTRNQVISLYQQVSWPFERKEVERLREKLRFFLELATYDISAANHDVARKIREDVRDIRDNHKKSNAELISSNLRLVSSHLDFVSLITRNLKRVTHPLEPGEQAEEIDLPMLRQFGQALHPPQPVRALEGPPSRSALPWGPRNHRDDLEYAALAPTAPYGHDTGSFDRDQNEAHSLISLRLDNMSMRMAPMESIPESGARESISSATQPLLERLREMRDEIGATVGIANQTAGRSGISTFVDRPENALREELQAWNRLASRIEREILHPGRIVAQKSETLSTSRPIPIPPRKASLQVSPVSSPYDEGLIPSLGGPPGPRSSAGSLSTSPNLSRPISHTGTFSTASASPPRSIRLGHRIPVIISYPNHMVNATIRSLARFDDGDVHSIISTSQDETTEIRHCIDLKAPALTETSMKPFLDNSHVDKAHKYRVQFQGAHNLKITKFDKVSRCQSAPIYKFHNGHDFLEFQGLLLNKEVKHCADVKYIKSTDDDAQCRQGTIRILLDPFSNSRYILYFRHTSDQKHGFVEWPVNIFKEPKEPGKKAHTLKLESQDGKSLSFSKGLSRRSTQGSVATISSLESSSDPAFKKIQDRSTKRNIKGLVIEFYDPAECHEFWNEFRKKEVSFSPSASSNGLGFTFPVELAA